MNNKTSNKNMIIFGISFVICSMSLIFALLIYSEVTYDCQENCEKAKQNTWYLTWYLTGVIPVIGFVILSHILEKKENNNE